MPYAEALQYILLLFLTQSSAIQMCDVVKEIELERKQCENRTAVNITSGKVYKTWDAEGHPSRWLYVFNIVIVCGHFPFKPLMQCQLVNEKLFFPPFPAQSQLQGLLKVHTNGYLEVSLSSEMICPPVTHSLL